MYRELNDYEIIYLISDNNDDNYGIMLEKYDDLFHKIINKYRYVVKKMGYEEEDLYQMCSLTLYKAVKSYNGDINSNMFYTYLLCSLGNTMLSTIRCNSTNKKKILNESFSYDNYVYDSEITYAEILPDPNINFLDDYIEYQGFYINFKNSFEFDVSCVLELKVEGYSNDEISTLLELSHNEVLTSIRKIRCKLLY